MLSSPLRYPGGKAKLFEFFAALIQRNRLFGCEYCEPYAGGAGLALKLLSGGFVKSVSLNDADPAVWAFWRSALDQNDAFCRMIAEVPLTIDEWHRQSSIWRQKDVENPLLLGFATFFLNRTNRSGIIEGAGPIGGYAQTGTWRLDARFERQKQLASIHALAPFRHLISIANLDALDFMERTLPSVGALTYLDPPYYVKGSKLYRNFYRHDDHVRVMDAVKAHRTSRWIVSYDDVPEIRSIYKDFSPISYSLNYSAGQAASGREVIYLSDSLSLPAFPGFEMKAA